MSDRPTRARWTEAGTNFWLKMNHWICLFCHRTFAPSSPNLWRIGLSQTMLATNENEDVRTMMTCEPVSLHEIPVSFTSCSDWWVALVANTQIEACWTIATEVGRQDAICTIWWCHFYRPDGIGTVLREEWEKFIEIKDRLRGYLENQITNFRYVMLIYTRVTG